MGTGRFALLPVGGRELVGRGKLVFLPPLEIVSSDKFVSLVVVESGESGVLAGVEGSGESVLPVGRGSVGVLVLEGEVSTGPGLPRGSVNRGWRFRRGRGRGQRRRIYPLQQFFSNSRFKAVSKMVDYSR